VRQLSENDSDAPPLSRAEKGQQIYKGTSSVVVKYPHMDQPLNVISSCEIVDTKAAYKPWDVFRLMDYDGYLLDEASAQKSLLVNDQELSTKVWETMIRLRTMDEILEAAQRQGRLTFYLQCRGEEGIHIGSASALTLKDPVLAQYREQGIIMWRGFTLEQFTDQCIGNERDLGRGRQMPIHESFISLILME